MRIPRGTVLLGMTPPMVFLRAEDRRRSRRTAPLLRIVCLLGLLGLIVLRAAAAQALPVISAPNFSRGPQLVDGGLLWAGTTSGQEGVFLSSTTGPRLLVPDAELRQVHVDEGWMVVAAPPIRAGRVGGTLSTVRRLHRCPPVDAEADEGFPPEEEGPLVTVSRGSVYAVVRAGCLSLRPRAAELLVRTRLGTQDLQVIRKVASGAFSLTAAGSRLALTRRLTQGTASRTPREAPLGVEVLDSRSGRLLYGVTSPRHTITSYAETQLDARGEILVTAVQPTPGPGTGQKFGWWGDRATRIGRSLGSFGELSGSLSDGNVAFSTYADGTALDVLHLATGATQTIATFHGAVRLEGLALEGNEVAWAQQHYGYVNASEGAGKPSCIGWGPVGPAELIEAARSPAATPANFESSVGPRPEGSVCPVPP